MEQHKPFGYDSIEELKADAKKQGIDLPFSEQLEVLRQPVKLRGKRVPNSLGILPMEGCDGTADGKPNELTYRRYDRFAKGGSGLIWMEATAVAPEGRANPHQLFLCKDNLEDFKKLYQSMMTASRADDHGESEPYTVLQLTYSGRYSKPQGSREPRVACYNPYLDKDKSKVKILTDVELQQLEDKYVEAAILAREIGFDAVDIKCCHGYLGGELLSAYTRAGQYGGSFENRTRFLINVVDKIHEKLGHTIGITLRLSAFDALPYPYGWGVSQESIQEPCMHEVIQLLKILRDKGIELVNISCGNPYYNPHVGRPYDKGSYVPIEHPLKGIDRMLRITKELQENVPEINIMASGFTWLREFAPYIAAGGIKEGWFKLAGFGRQAFAYPDFAKDIIRNGNMERKKCCKACSKCTVIMRDGGKTGCVPLDAKIYAPIYLEGRLGKSCETSQRISDHIE